MARSNFAETMIALEVERFRLIVTELDLAITFSDAALTADTETKVRHNSKCAHEAYRIASHLLKRAALSTGTQQQVETRIERLRPLLEELDRRSEKPADKPIPWVRSYLSFLKGPSGS